MNRTTPVALCATTAVALLALGSAPAQATPTEFGVDGETRANAPSTLPDISSGGRWVVFGSLATDLATGDTNGKSDIFIRDTVYKKTRLVTKSYTGGPANGNSSEPQVSDDGRFVVYMSDASNLVSGDTNGKTDIFRTDLSNGKTQRISTTASGGQLKGVSRRPRINSTASIVAFVSTAANVVPGDTNGIADIFVRNLGAGTLKRISVTPKGGQLSVQSYSPSVSFDGKIVGFQTDSFSDPTVNSWCGSTADALQIIMKHTISTSKTSIVEVVCRQGTREWVQEPRANLTGGVGYAKASDYGYTTFAGRGTDGIYQELYAGSSYSKAYWDTGRWGGVMAYTNSDSSYVYVADKYGVEASAYYPANGVSMSPDGAWTALQGRTDGQIYAWNWQTGAWILVSTR